MRGHVYAQRQRLLGATFGGALMLGALPVAAMAEDEGLEALASCDAAVSSEPLEDVEGSLWRTLLDEEGEVTGHRLTLRLAGGERRLAASRRGFALRAGHERVLIGQRDQDGTRLDMVDTRLGCRVWTRLLDRHAFPERVDGDGRVRLSLHDRGTRAYRASLLMDAETGATEGTDEGACLEVCYPSDGDLSLSALEPATAARPTPEFPAGAWPKDSMLPFRWASGAVPPTWAQDPITDGANDAHQTAHARSPQFPQRSNAPNAIAYTGSLPAFCSDAAIACARRSIPTYWGVWVRPYGTEYAWGTLRWCQKTSSGSGCFDLRRVALHELGHIVGLDHPSSAGFTLSSSDSVMQGITPARPHAGASRHAFGRCDVATLQELYDTPDNRTPISTCNSVSTDLGLSASSGSVKRGGSVTLTAELHVQGDSAYRQLSGNPLNGRAVQLKYRRADSDDEWQSAWMRSLFSSGRYELSLTPSTTWELKAVFQTPADEGLRYSRSEIRKVKVNG